jgi:hypothetical protein
MKIPTQLLVLLTLGVTASQTLAGCADTDDGSDMQTDQHNGGLNQLDDDSEDDDELDNPSASAGDAGAQTGDAAAAEAPKKPSKPRGKGFSCPACGMG